MFGQSGSARGLVGLVGLGFGVGEGGEESVPGWMMVQWKVRRSTMAARRRAFHGAAGGGGSLAEQLGPRGGRPRDRHRPGSRP